jgi:predicted dehydrogenase
MIKVAVVGFGFMGITHTLNILKNKDLKLVAIVDSNIDLIEKNLISKGGNLATGDLSADYLEGIHKYSSLDDCLNSEDIDVVNICVHLNLHYDLAKKALLRGKNVFLEKPFCLDIKKAEELIYLAEQKKGILMIGHVVRFMPPYQKLKQWIDSKEYGDLKFLSLSRFSGYPAWGQWKDKDVRNTSGGALFDLAIHDIDFASYVLGTPIDIKCNYLPGDFSKHDYISAMWGFKKENLQVKIEGGFTFHIKFPFQAGYMVQFEKASLLYTSLKGNIITITNNDSTNEVPSGDPGDGYYNEIAYFAQCLKNNTQPIECMPVSSLESIKLCYNHINQ